MGSPKSVKLAKKAKMRRCLRCHKMFYSKSSENRICNSCKNINRNKIGEDYIGGLVAGVNW